MSNNYAVGGAIPSTIHRQEENLGPDPAAKLDRNPNLDGASGTAPMTGVHVDQAGSGVPRTLPGTTIGESGLNRPPSLRKESATETISDLHVPGQYPKSRNEAGRPTVA